MKKFLFIFGLILIAQYSFPQTNGWQFVGGRITTPWADSVNPSNVLPAYPRPQLKRNDWQNLNGLWQYAILPQERSGDITKASSQGNILVPFCIESALSGVGKTVGKDSILLYKRSFNIASKNKR